MASNSDELQSDEVMTHLADKLPHIDDRYATRPYRHGWMLVLDRDKPYEGPGGPFIGVINSLAHIDLSTGETKTWWPGAQCGIQEPCFIPRSADAPEGEGYVVALVDNHVTNYSELCFFDAQRVDEGPIGRARLPVRIRQGLHGNWSTGAQLAAAA